MGLSLIKERTARMIGLLKKKVVIKLFWLVLAFVIAISFCGCGNQKSDRKAKMIGETFCLIDQEQKQFYRTPVKIDKVYGYNQSGEEVVFKENIDYLIDLSKGTISRSPNSTIPNYKDHRVYLDRISGKFAFNSEPRNPELNVRYQVKVDYQYPVEDRDIETISNKSIYLSESVKRKIIDKKNIKIIVAGDSIAGAAQTTAQYYFDNRMADGFSGMLKTSLEGYYGCKIDMSLFSEGGGRQIFSVEQSKRSY